jgi:phytoene dehydrogenase-like protein
MKEYIVVGGGLAGLTAANALTGGGRHKVTLLEQSNRLGGRGITQQDRGYLLNLGPHALHRNGVAAQPSGAGACQFAANHPTRARRPFGAHWPDVPAGFTIRGLLTTRLFSASEKLQAVRVLKQLSGGPASEGESIKEWIEQRAR